MSHGNGACIPGKRSLLLWLHTVIHFLEVGKARCGAAGDGLLKLPQLCQVVSNLRILCSDKHYRLFQSILVTS